MNDDDDDDDDQKKGQIQTQMEEKVFHHLDPTLRLLLACNEQLKFIHDDSETDMNANTNANNNTNANANAKKEEIILTLYKTQSSIFKRLENDISSCFHSNNNDGNDDDNDDNDDDDRSYYTHRALHDMEEYIMLPIILTFQQQQQPQQQRDGMTNMNTSTSTSSHVRQSASRKSIEYASSCLQTYLHCLYDKQIHTNNTSRNDNGHEHGHGHGNFNEHDNDNDNDNTTKTKTKKSTIHNKIITMSTKIQMKCIIALTMTLTSIIQQSNYGTTTTTTTTTATLTKSSSSSNLDKGDACIQALLSCLQSLLLVSSSSSISSSITKSSPRSTPRSTKEKEFITQFVNYIPNSGLMVGIVQNCLQCLDQGIYKHWNGNGNSNDHDHDDTNSNTYTHSNGITMGVDIGIGSSTGTGNSRERKRDIRGNVELKLHALKILEVLLGLSPITNDSCDSNGKGNDNDNRNGDNDGDNDCNNDKEDPIVICFRNIFPTCFAVLFRQIHAHLQFTTSFSSSKLTIQYMHVLSLLMKKTLQQQHQTSSKQNQDQGQHGKRSNEERKKNDKSNNTVNESTKKLLFAVSNLKTSVTDDSNNIDAKDSNGSNDIDTITSTTTNTKSRKSNNIDNNTLDAYRIFVQNVKQRVPFPLTILCELIPKHTSIKVRKAGIRCLCKCILVDTLTIWDERGNNEGDMNNTTVGNDLNLSVFHDLRERAFECLMIMLDDENQEVSKTCMEIFNMHQLKVRTCVQNQSVNQHMMMTRVSDIILSLPNIARSRRESDLKMKMKLISGYISIICRVRPSQKGGASHDYLIRKMMKNPHKQCFVDIFSLEDNINNNYIISSVSTGQQFRYMHDDTTIVAKGMMHKIAQLLGPKQCAIFADGCIADIFDSLSERIQNQNLSVCDKNHFIWTQQHYGLAVIAVELIKGQKQIGIKKRHLKIFNSFTKSVLPILFSEPLWQLPSTFKWAQPVKSTIERTDRLMHDSVFKYSEHHIIPTSKATKGIVGQSTDHEFVSNVSATALHGNALLHMIFMQMIEALSSILETNFNECLPTVLYPLLQKASDINSAIVQRTSLDTITAVSLSSGYRSFEDMLSTYFRYIVEVFTSELQGSFVFHSEKHLREQAVCFYSLHTVIKLILQSLTKQKESERNTDSRCPPIDETQLMVLMDMIQTINTWFNKNFKKSVKNLVTMMVVPLGMLQVFKACTEYMDSLLQVSNVPEAQELNNDSPWMDLLLQFECDNDKEDDDITINGREGFQQYLTSKDHDLDIELLEDAKEDEREQVLSSETLKRLIGIIQQVMLTNSMFLSIPDLRLQRESCDLFSNSFHLLNTIQCFGKDPNSGISSSDIGNPLLETVSKYWHPLQSRFQGTIQSLYNKNNYDATARMHLGFLLSSLLDVISTVSELCDGFIADRFQSTIFPHMSRLFETFLREVDGSGNEKEIICSSLLFAKEDGKMLNALLDCVYRVFSANGSHLLAMVPSVGSIIFPFIALDGPIGDSAMEAMKALVTVDSDSLWRALLITSGMGIPERPLLPMKRHVNAIAETPLSRRCLEIINYVHELPEQDILNY